jgi:hypothetical protein
LGNYNDKDYYIVECKRVDGNSKSNLNYRYVRKGIVRFVLDPITYTSYHNKNIMFGYVVKNIDVPENTKKINATQIRNKKLSSYVKQGLTLQKEKIPKFWIYSSLYKFQDKPDLELRHLFYNFLTVNKHDAE